MSVSSQYSRIQTARNRIINHLVSLGLANGNETLDSLAAMVETLRKVPVVTTQSYTLTTSGWSNKNYSLEGSFPSSRYDISIEPSSSCTAAQLKAYSKARPVGSTSNNIITAYGTVPTVNIPIIVTATEK